MAIRIIDRYPNRATPASSDYPHGAFQNRTSSTSDDGTPLEQDWRNDDEAFFQALMEAAGIAYSGSVDTVPTSQLIQALKVVTAGFTDVDVSGSSDVTLGTDQSRVVGIRLFGSLGSDIDVIVPDTQRVYMVINDTTGGYKVTFRASNGGVSISSGTGGVIWLRCTTSATVVRMTGTAEDEVPANSDLGTAAQADIGALLNQVPANSDIRLFSNKKFTIPSDYADLQAAVDDLQYLDPNGYTITLEIESGHKITRGLRVQHGSLSHFYITSVDKPVLLDNNFTGADGSDIEPDSKESIFVVFNARGPILDTFFNMNNTYDDGIIIGGTGVMYIGGISTLGFNTGNGVREAGRHGLVCRTGYVYGRQTNFFGANEQCVRMTSGAVFDLGGVIANDGGRTYGAGNFNPSGIMVSRASYGSAQNAEVKNGNTVGVSVRRSWCNLEECDIQNNGQAGGASDRGIDCRDGSHAIVNLGLIDGHAADIRINTNGGTVHAHGATYGNTSEPVNTFTNSGYILDNTV